jgi:NADPH:quinone reductase-like Zn-dependent oxidoreductase
MVMTTKTMRAAVYDRYGPPDVLRLEDLPAPEATEDRLLVRVHATSVTRSDAHMRAAHPWLSRFVTGLRRPKYPIGGNEYAGVVEAVGPEVQEFRPGDRVFGCTGGFRAHAELVAVRERSPVAPMPEGLSFEEAAASTDGPILTLNSLKLVSLEGRRLLVYGASGSMGTASVQLGKHFGAHVTAVTDTRHLELARELGADEVLDYTQEDWTKRGETWDVLHDAVGKLRFLAVRKVLARGGSYLPTDGFGNIAFAPLTRWADKRVRMQLPPRYLKEDVLLLARLLEEGRYRPVIDRTYPLAEIAEASRYVETGQKTGNVVLTVS